MAWSPEGHLYFTDPPYGLKTKAMVAAAVAEAQGKDSSSTNTTNTQSAHDQEERDNKTDTTEIINNYLDHSSLREIDHNGLYMISAADIAIAIETGIPTEKVHLLDAKISRPNGIAFSPDFSKLYVSNSDPKRAVWYVYDVKYSGLLENGRVFFDATEEISSGRETFGLPDGLKVDIHGNLFATGPGGVLIISPEGRLLGRFRTDRAVSNIVFGSDNRVYITAADLVIRKLVNTKPSRIVGKIGY